VERTPSQTIGPFFHLCLTTPRGCVACLAAPDSQGERVRIAVRVLDGDGAPVNDAMVEAWQADATGFRGFGRLATDENGLCVFETIRPAPHVDLSVFARGLLDRVVTRIYFAGDPANERDAVLALVPCERRETLLAHPDLEEAGLWNFEIRLCGDRETVFFEV